MKDLAKKMIIFGSVGLLLYAAGMVMVPGVLMANFNSTDWFFGKIYGELSSGPCPDILVLGSSHAYRSFDPRVAETNGVRLSNLASPLQTPLNSYFLLDAFLRERSRIGACIPRAIAIELYEKTLRDEGLESFTKTLDDRPLELADALHGIAIRDPLAMHMLVARIGERVFGTGTNSAKLRPFEMYVQGGFISTVTERKRPSDGKSAESATVRAEIVACSRNPQSCVPSERQLDYLQRTMRLIRSAGAIPVLVVAPMPSDVEARNPYLGSANAAIRSLAEKNGASLISDFSKAELDDYSDFSDGTHLNNTGAEKVTGEFIRRLLLIPGYGSAPESSS
ncbi:MAG TPA: SGNH/GDSL hydrolase family protein [Candidatus Paceibacterota bacterium]